MPRRSAESEGGRENRQPFNKTVGVPDTPIFCPRAMSCSTRRIEAPSLTHCSNAIASGTFASAAYDVHGFRFWACAHAGVDGFCERGASLDGLVAAIVGASRGELEVTPRVAAALFRRVRRPDDAKPSIQSPGLTEREADVYELLRLTNKEIASRLGLSVSTVKNHVHSLLTKLGVHRRSDAITDSLGSLESRGVRIESHED